MVYGAIVVVAPPITGPMGGGGDLYTAGNSENADKISKAVWPSAAYILRCGVLEFIPDVCDIKVLRQAWRGSRFMPAGEVVFSAEDANRYFMGITTNTAGERLRRCLSEWQRLDAVSGTAAHYRLIITRVRAARRRDE